jgi:hypothetical protein
MAPRRSHNLGVPRPEYDKNPKIYAEVEKVYKDKLEDIRAFLGFKFDRDVLKHLIDDFHKRNKVPPSPMRKR